jgi:hypothetical protein
MNYFDVLKLTIRNYMALRQEIPELRNKEFADMIRAHNYAQSKDVEKIVAMYDPPAKG